MPRSSTPSQQPLAADSPATHDPHSTQNFQARMPSAPVWVASMVAGNTREKNRLRAEIEQIKDAIHLLMKKRKSGKWTADDRRELRTLLRSVSSVSPYLLIWAVPGSMLLLPFLAWHLDSRRKRRAKLEAAQLLLPRTPEPDIRID